MRMAGYYSLCTPEASDNFPEFWSSPIHQQVGPENLDGQ